MKKIYSILRGLFAIIGLLFVALIAIVKLGGYKIGINISESDETQHETNVGILRQAGAYQTDSVNFKMRIVQDSVKAKEIMDYFRLDTLYSADASTWDMAISIAKFVAENIPHANPKVQPEHRNAIALWEYTKKVEPAFNCRLHSILTFELMLAAGLTPKYVTCLPQDKNDTDCHVVNEVWLPELGKWAMIDSDSNGNYASDNDGVPLSISELRELYISGKEIFMHPRFGEGDSDITYYHAYMAKNTYWFTCQEILTYGIEDSNSDNKVIGRMLNLIPSGFIPFNTWDKSVNTTNADAFWAKPEQ